MDSIIQKLIDQLNTSVFVLLVVLWAVGYTLMKVGEWKEKFSQHRSRIDNLESLSDKVVAISTKIDLIYNFVNPNSMVRSRSPLSLTATGEQTAASLNADAILDKYYDRLRRDINLNDPQNAYDIQKYAMQIAKEQLIRLMDANEINTFKQAAYNKGVLMEDILSIFGVLLRDKVLSEKGIPIAEVDIHAPD